MPSRIRSLHLLPALAAGTLCLSCVTVAPLYERARPIEDGYSVCGGLRAEYGQQIAGRTDDLGLPYEESALTGNGFVQFRRSLNRGTLFMLAGGGMGAWAPDLTGEVYPVLVQAGVKAPIAEYHSIRLAAGYPDILAVAWLADYGQHWTSLLGLSLAGLSIGGTWHVELGRGLVGHVSLGVAARPLMLVMQADLRECSAASAGFAVEWQSEPNTPDVWPDFLGRPPND